jgi:hypothetical protein
VSPVAFPLTAFVRAGRTRGELDLPGENLRKFTETRAAAPRALCIDFAAVKNTVQVFAEWFLGPKNQNLVLTFVQLH